MSPSAVDQRSVSQLAECFEAEHPKTVLAWAIERFSDRIVLATSFQADGVAILDMAYEIDPGIRIFTIDTGRLPEETFELIERLRGRYPGLNLEIVMPQTAQVERMVSRNGPNLFYESVENRELCCHVRKVLPLRRFLAPFDAWITGLRRGHSASRASTNIVEIDQNHGGIVKINPLAAWTQERVWDYILEREVPHHPLYDRGYTSIGCAPCTRAIELGESARAGRWWWEGDGKKECGIHAQGTTADFDGELETVVGIESH